MRLRHTEAEGKASFSLGSILAASKVRSDSPAVESPSERWPGKSPNACESPIPAYLRLVLRGGRWIRCVRQRAPRRGTVPQSRQGRAKPLRHEALLSLPISSVYRLVPASSWWSLSWLLAVQPLPLATGMMIARGGVGRFAAPLPCAADCAGRRLSTTVFTISRPLRPHAPLPWRVPLSRFVFPCRIWRHSCARCNGIVGMLLAFVVESFINRLSGDSEWLDWWKCSKFGVSNVDRIHGLMIHQKQTASIIDSINQINVLKISTVFCLEICIFIIKTSIKIALTYRARTTS